MRLCDWYTLKTDDPANRCPRGPTRATEEADPLRCFACGGWTPHGNLPSIDRVSLLAREVASIVERLADDYPCGHSVSFAPTRNGHGGGNGSTRSDPTGNAVADPRRATVQGYTAVAARLLERAVHALRSADEAIGEAVLAAEPPGRAGHTKAAYHDTAGLRYPEPEVYAAQARRHARGEGIPS